jgi:hypothetical protein
MLTAYWAQSRIAKRLDGASQISERLLNIGDIHAHGQYVALGTPLPRKAPRPCAAICPPMPCRLR